MDFSCQSEIVYSNSTKQQETREGFLRTHHGWTLMLQTFGQYPILPPTKYAHSFVVLCFIVVTLSVLCGLMGSIYPSQIAMFMGPTWGPPGFCRPQMGPMLAPWTLLSGIFSKAASLALGQLRDCSSGSDISLKNLQTCTAQCRYIAVTFLPNSHYRHHIALPWGRGMGCLLWVWCLITFCSCHRSVVISWKKMDRVITALDCNIDYWYHNIYWFPSSFQHNSIHGIEYAEYTGWGNLLTSCAIWVLRNHRKCKYIFMFAKMNLAQQWLSQEVAEIF